MPIITQSSTVPIQEKTCTKCKTSKPLDKFYDNPRMRLGKQSRCKECQSKATKRWRQESTDSYLTSARRIVRRYKAYWRAHNPYEETKEKACPHCKQPRSGLDFDECHAVKDGLQSWCRECSRTRLQKAPLAYSIFWVAKSRAKSKGIEFSLKVEDILVPPVCPVLGIPLYTNRGKAGPNSPSLDRIDNKRGYIPGNVRVISYRANILKGDASVEEVRKILAYMEDHR